MRRLGWGALACLAAVLAGCGGDDASEAPRATATPRPMEVGPPLPGAFTALKAGTTYTTQKFQPPLRVTAGEGEWLVETADSAEHFSLSRQDAAGIDQAILGVHRITRVFDPEKGGVIPGDEVPFEGDFAAWLAEHPHLRATGRKEIDVAGLKGVQLDVTSTGSPPKVPDDCGKLAEPCVALFHDGFDDVMYGGDSKGRFLVLEIDGPQLVVEQYVEPRSKFGAGIEALRPVLEALQPAP